MSAYTGKYAIIGPRTSSCADLCLAEAVSANPETEAEW
jgi:hypothetical protein